MTFFTPSSGCSFYDRRMISGQDGAPDGSNGRDTMAGRDPKRRVKLADRLAKKGPRKLLAIDGGGIRGVLSLHILGKIEEILVKESKRPDYRLADYFDYVAGTSTGGIIAAGISLGMSVAEILDFYVRNGAAMFDKASIMQRLRYEYNSEPLAKQLKRVFGEDTTLGAKELECLLLRASYPRRIRALAVSR